MSRKLFYILCSFLYFLIVEQAIAQDYPKSVEEIYTLLKTIPPGTSKRIVLDYLGEPQLVEGNVFSWYWKETDFDKVTVVALDNDCVSIGAYFEFPDKNLVKTEEDAKEINLNRYTFFRSELCKLSGIPVQEIPDFAATWHIGENFLLLMKAVTAEGSTGIGVLLQRQIIQ